VMQDPSERRVGRLVRMPEPVEPAETGGRQRFVDGDVRVDPRVPLRHRMRERGEALGEVGVEQVGVRRAVAVMQQPDDRTDAELAQAPEALVGERPVGA
jgi:hypothetical protein